MGAISSALTALLGAASSPAHEQIAQQLAAHPAYSSALCSRYDSEGPFDLDLAIAFFQQLAVQQISPQAPLHPSWAAGSGYFDTITGYLLQSTALCLLSNDQYVVRVALAQGHASVDFDAPSPEGVFAPCRVQWIVLWAAIAADDERAAGGRERAERICRRAGLAAHGDPAAVG